MANDAAVAELRSELKAVEREMRMLRDVPMRVAPLICPHPVTGRRRSGEAAE